MEIKRCALQLQNHGARSRKWGPEPQKPDSSVSPFCAPLGLRAAGSVVPPGGSSTFYT